ncbi:MAG: universal stress protein [Balneolia bacterium]|nr:universal stress protein [Balneolia bacterium]
MESLKKWVVCLDLTKMDEAVIGYVNYFAEIAKPESIQFLHVVESYDMFHDIIEEFPELETEEDLNELLTKQIQEQIDAKFTHTDVKTSISFRKGSATDQIIRLMDKENPDLLVLGKKAGYKGEGVLARRIVKYVPCSILFVPETARYNMENITVPIDFSEQSEEATRFALQLVKPAGGNVIAQHLYEYPKQFFPYMPDKKTIKKMDEELQAKKKAFSDKIKTPGDTDLDTHLTLHQDGKMSDDIYDLCITNQTDMIVVFSKARSTMMALMKDKLPDRMASYPFGIPLLIMKNKARNQKLFKKMMD